ncbi:MAG TPA: thioesterase family protein [Baekduia sp.]|nr:thioesterase family protein [Baekduia sp.]
MATTPEVASFERDTAVQPAGDGRWRAEISPLWGVPHGPNGGYVAAIVLRAMEAAIGDAQRAPRSLTLHYLRPPAAGPCEVAVAIERAGRTLTSVSARLVQDGRPMVVALGAFAGGFPTAADYADPAPDVPPPATLHTVPDGPGVPPIAQRCAMAPVFGGEPLTGAGEALVGGWLRLAEPRIADAATVAFYCDAWLPSPFPRLTAPAPAPTIDLTIHFRARLPHAGMAADDPVLVRFRSGTSRDGLFEEDGEVWAPDGTLLAQSRQLAILMPGR